MELPRWVKFFYRFHFVLVYSTAMLPYETLEALGGGIRENSNVLGKSQDWQTSPLQPTQSRDLSLVVRYKTKSMTAATVTRRYAPRSKRPLREVGLNQKRDCPRRKIPRQREYSPRNWPQHPIINRTRWHAQEEVNTVISLHNCTDYVGTSYG